MNIRKIAAAAGLACGAAMAFAPLAAADTDPFITLLDSEISQENSLFEFEALLAGDSADVTKATVPGTFDTILAKDVPYFPVGDTADASKVTPLEYELYGVNPIQAGISHDAMNIGTSGPFSEFNGALTKFDDAYNVLLYAAEHQNALIPVADVFGNHLEFVTGTGATAATAFSDFYNFGVGDLGGYLGVNLNFLDISHVAATDLFSLFDPSALLGSV